MAVLGIIAVLAANSVCLAAVTFFEWATGNVYQNWLYQWMFLGHLVIGIAFVAPFAVFGAVLGRSRPQIWRRSPNGSAAA